MPAVLIAAIGRTPVGPLPLDTAQKLIDFAKTQPKVVIDGFPASEEHLSLLPGEAKVLYIWVPENKRQDRLQVRAENTPRQWVQGKVSLRETALPVLVRQLRKKGMVRFIKNEVDGAESVVKLANQILSVGYPSRLHLKDLVMS